MLAKRLNAALRQELNLSSKNGGGAVGNPHLTIAYRDLTPENYRAAMLEFENRVFEALLEVRSFHLMKQERGWKSVREFHLTGAEDYEEKQKLLFP